MVMSFMDIDHEKKSATMTVSPEIKAVLMFDEWISVRGENLPASSIHIDSDGLTVIYGQEGILMKSAVDKIPGMEGLIQKVELTFLRDIFEVLLDLRIRVNVPAALDWLTVPGLFYGDNNLDADRVIFPKDMRVDWSFRADASGCPGVHLPGKDAGYGAFMPTDRVELAENGEAVGAGEDILGIGWVNRAGGRDIRLTFPCQESPHTFHRPDVMGQSRVPVFSGRAGLTLSFEIYHFATGGGRQGYFQPVRYLYERNRPSGVIHNPARLRATAELFAKCMKESHFLPGIGFSHRQDLPEIHSGWSGGFAAVEAGLVYGEAFGDPIIYNQAEQMADFICQTGCSSVGYFNGEYRDGRWWPNVYWGKAKGLHIRHASEGCLFLGRILMRESAKGNLRSEWRQAFYRNLCAVLRDQRPDGALPIEVHPETGRAMDWEGVTPGTWAGSLIIGACLAEEEGREEQGEIYRKAAAAVADYYLIHYIQRDLFFGGPYDAHRVPNMEDAYNLLNACTELYRYFKEPRYLSGAQICADHLISWRYVYDAEFPMGTICREQQVSTFGMSPASVRNRHIQNWDTVAAVALNELSGWTGDPFYARTALDHLNQSCQLVERGDGALGIPKGGQSEQWYATEFFWFGSFGDYGKGNLWKVSVVLPKSGFLTALALVDKWSRLD